MKRFRVIYAVETERQLAQIYRYIAAESSPSVARRYTDAIVAQCQKLERFPHRGTPRDDLRAGLRKLTFRRRTQILYSVNGDDVEIAGVYYGGQDYEARFRGHEEI